MNDKATSIWEELMERVQNYQLIGSVASSVGGFSSLCEHRRVCDKWGGNSK